MAFSRVAIFKLYFHLQINPFEIYRMRNNLNISYFILIKNKNETKNENTRLYFCLILIFPRKCLRCRSFLNK